MTPSEIRSAREAAGLTQTRAAEIAGVKFRTWQDWELGIAAPNLPALRVFLHRTGQKSIPIDHKPVK